MSAFDLRLHFVIKGTFMCVFVFLFFLQQMTERFLLVEFLEAKDVAVIPSSWLVSKDTAVWPPYHSSTRIDYAVRNRNSPSTEWAKYSVKIMYESGTVYAFYVSQEFSYTFVIQRLTAIGVVAVPYIISFYASLTCHFWTLDTISCT